MGHEAAWRAQLHRAEGDDAGVRPTGAIEREVVQVRLTDAFGFVVVGAPADLERHGAPPGPEDLPRHERRPSVTLAERGLYPGRARSSPAPRLFVEAARALAAEARRA